MNSSQTTAPARRRPDGRSLDNANTLRPLSCELSTLHRADGSALWKSGSTHVLAAVYGPIAPRIISQEQSDAAVVSVVLQQQQQQGNSSGSAAATSSSSTAREWEQVLVSVLAQCMDRSLYVRTVVQVVLHVIQDDGGVLSAALHAAVAALMDAGVAMIQLPVATAFVVVRRDHPREPLIILMDPTLQEEQDPHASIVVLVTSQEQPDQLLATHTHIANHGVSIASLLSCAQAAAKAVPAVVTFWRLAVEQRVTREAQTLWSVTTNG